MEIVPEESDDNRKRSPSPLISNDPIPEKKSKVDDSGVTDEVNGFPDEEQKNDESLELLVDNKESEEKITTDIKESSPPTKNVLNDTIVSSVHGVAVEDTNGAHHGNNEFNEPNKADEKDVECEQVGHVTKLEDNGSHDLADVVEPEIEETNVAVDKELSESIEESEEAAKRDGDDELKEPMAEAKHDEELITSTTPMENTEMEISDVNEEEKEDSKTEPLQQIAEKESAAPKAEITDAATEDLLKLFAGLKPIPSFSLNPMNPLSISELTELESVLEFSKTASSTNEESQWRNDWSGNLAYIDKEIRNPLTRVKSNRSRQNEPPLSGRAKKAMDKMTLLQWTKTIEESRGARSSTMRRLLKNLFRHVCTHCNTDQDVLVSEGNSNHSIQNIEKAPQSVINLLGVNVIETCTLSDIEDTIRRASYDPQVLQEDGWTVVRTISSESATGGAFRIGERIRYEGYDAVVIAYIHDTDIGDLWKAIWLEDFVAFDLEAEELNLARQKWEKHHKKSDRVSSAQATARRRPPNREVAIGANGSLDFFVKGVEYGIVLASSYSKGARAGVQWPARIMHASESPGTTRRNSSKTQRKLELVFLASYWNSMDDATISAGKSRVGPPLSENEEAVFNTNPLFQFETVDATHEMVKEYPSNIELEGSYLDIAQLRMSFRFTGLPKALFPRYVDAHRLATCIRAYARSHLVTSTPSPEKASSYRATAALLEAHPLSVQVPLFPPVILHLPYSFILAQLTSPTSSTNGSDSEPLIQLNSILDSMKPPLCWGQQIAIGPDHQQIVKSEQIKTQNTHDTEKSSGEWLQSSLDPHAPDHVKLLSKFVVDFPSLSKAFDDFSSTPSLTGLISSIRQFVDLSDLNVDLNVVSDGDNSSAENRIELLKSKVAAWVAIKKLIEESLSGFSASDTYIKDSAIKEWRKASELIYRHVISQILKATRAEIDELCTTLVVTDSLCNEHRTSDKCLERRVRLPAAIKAAKLAGAKESGPIRLVPIVDPVYVEFVEKNVVNKAHSSCYLKRMKNRCASALTKEEILVLTDDSDDNGGQDTRGSQGTWTAALCGVAAAVSATDKVVRGECMNAFCITRPPGHHAGRSLHPMKACSNGFCILNPAACAAIHATSPLGEGGLGLQRVCIIDFDVHHGNGTQDILCSTYDPRYLYVSLHAGGAHINGTLPQSDPSDEPYGLAKNPKLSGIYPGRCGDTSPHRGVLNIPLGSKVMSHAVGTALLQHVTPAVETFSPELIILSAGFDAHKNDPMGLGGLSAEDFGSITELVCQLAMKSCSGRIVSILEGGYGVPCCRPQQNTFLPETMKEPLETDGNVDDTTSGVIAKVSDTDTKEKERPQPSRLLDLGDNLPDDMDDQVPYPLQVRLEKCHTEGFLECVFEHVSALSRCSVDRKC